MRTYRACKAFLASIVNESQLSNGNARGSRYSLRRLTKIVQPEAHHLVGTSKFHTGMPTAADYQNDSRCEALDSCCSQLVNRVTF